MIPSEITQGDSLDWDESESNYPASDSWVIHYVLVNAKKRIAFNSVADGDSHSFVIPTSTTDAWVSGEYNFSRYVTDGTEKITLSRGTVEIKRDYTTAGDERTHARKTLDAIEAVIEDRATLDQESYTIGGRSLNRMPIADLLSFRDTYSKMVASEKNAEKLAQGLGTRQTIRVRF